MSKTSIDLKQGIRAHFIKTDQYKTDLTCVIITTALKRENVTKNALIPFILRRGNMRLQNQYLINRELENLYGASFNCGIDKMGDNVVLKFYIESIGNEYALNGENILKACMENLLEIVFNPIQKDGVLNKDFLEIEKENLKDVIESKIDEKDSYALDRCISAMYCDTGYGLYKYGYVEDVDSITIEEVSEYYSWLIDNSKIDIYISGNINSDEMKTMLEQNENIKKLRPRIENYVLNNEFTEVKEEPNEEKTLEEKMNVTQGKLVVGLDVTKQMDNLQAIGLVYNAILGDGANSMMFQNVREKEGLAYSAKSIFVKQKLNIFIRCGIQIENFQKALDLIRVQLDNIKQGKFTDEDIENAKTYLISGIKTIEEEQDTEVVFYIGQEISKVNMTLDEYTQKINSVSKEDVVNFANSACINTVYFLRN